MKWRKVKKQFKKKTLPKMLGRMVQTEDAQGNILQGEIERVKILPAGGKRVNFDCTVGNIMVVKAEPKATGKGFSITSSLSISKEDAKMFRKAYGL